MPWGVAAAAVSAAGSIYSSSQMKGPSAGPSEALLQQSIKQSKRDYSPYIEQGRQAQQQMLNQLGLGTGPAVDISTLPGYANILQQGMSAVNQGYAGGGLLGGNAMRALQQTGMNTASSYYQDYMNRLSGIAGTGFSATNNLAQIRAGALSDASKAAYGISEDQANVHNAQLSAYSGAFSQALGAGAGYLQGGSQKSQGSSTLGSQVDWGSAMTPSSSGYYG